MNNLEKFALNCGLNITDKPYVYEKFYPLPVTEYIVLFTGAEMESCLYSYWNEVVEILKKYLHKDIAIIQLGGDKDKPVNGCLRLEKSMDINTISYIIGKSKLCICGDSLAAHIAGANKIPLVCLYGSTSSEVGAPYFRSESILLDSKRAGNKPTFEAVENPKTIDMINPEDVAKASLKLLNQEEEITIDSLHIGTLFSELIIEYIPDCPFNYQIDPNIIINIRADYCFDENNIASALNVRKCLIITDKPINLKIIQSFKSNLIGINIKLNDNFDNNYLTSLKQLGVNVNIFVEDFQEDELQKIRFKFFDFTVRNLENLTKENVENFDRINNDTKFKTNKFLLGRQQLYLCKDSYLQNKPSKSFQDNHGTIYDTTEFWKQQQHLYIYNQ